MLLGCIAALAERDEARRVEAFCAFPRRGIAVAELGLEGAAAALGAVRRSGALSRKPRVAGAETELSAGLLVLLHSPVKAQT